MSLFDTVKGLFHKTKSAMPDNVTNTMGNVADAGKEQLGNAIDQVQKVTPDSVDNVLEKGKDILGQ